MSWNWRDSVFGGVAGGIGDTGDGVAGDTGDVFGGTGGGVAGGPDRGKRAGDRVAPVRRGARRRARRGALRHGGVVPRDHDMDVGILAESAEDAARLERVVEGPGGSQCTSQPPCRETGVLCCIEV